MFEILLCLIILYREEYILLYFKNIQEKAVKFLNPTIGSQWIFFI